jgi:RNA polymerase sigma factor (sigma-70 family)
MTTDGLAMPQRPEAIEAELERHHRASFAWSLACCGRDREEAEDVLQTSYLKVLDGRARYAGRSSFRTFLFGVIRRTASESRRRRAVRRLFAARRTGENARASTASARGSGPEIEERLALVAALGRLPRRQREMVELVFYAGMTVDEAGEALGVSAGTARVHYDRGKKHLAALLGIAR